MRYAIIKADGTHQVVEQGNRLNYKQVQALVAAPDEQSPMYQALPGGPNLSILINENGKYLPLDNNQALTRYARDNGLIYPHDYISGDAVIVGGVDDEGYEMDVDDEVLQTILAYLQ